MACKYSFKSQHHLIVVSGGFCVFQIHRHESQSCSSSISCHGSFVFRVPDCAHGFRIWCFLQSPPPAPLTGHHSLVMEEETKAYTDLTRIELWSHSSHPGRLGSIICRAQCKINANGPFKKISQWEFRDGNSQALNWAFWEGQGHTDCTHTKLAPNPSIPADSRVLSIYSVVIWSTLRSAFLKVR